MRRPLGPAENTSRGLLILILLFVILIGVIIAFSRTFIVTIAGTETAVTSIALVVAFALSLVLLGVTLFQIVRLLRQRAMRQAGAGLKLRLTLFFILISVLSAVPQSMLAITFINSAMGTWFSSSIGEALRGRLPHGHRLPGERVQNLRSFTDGDARAFPRAPLRPGPRRRVGIHQEVNPGIGALQLFCLRRPGDRLPRGPARAHLGLLHRGRKRGDPAARGQERRQHPARRARPHRSRQTGSRPW